MNLTKTYVSFNKYYIIGYIGISLRLQLCIKILLIHTDPFSGIKNYL